MDVVTASMAILLLNIQLITGDSLNVLVFGGNGFIGAETVEKLLSENHEVTIINRGNWRWDSEERVKPSVRHISCDRMETLKKCKGIRSLMDQEDGSLYFNFIIDFSAYYAHQIIDALRTFHKQFGKYIYISTDSVYDVCTEKNHTGFSLESDAVRPVDPQKRREYSQKDGYGNDKLEGEEVLMHSGIPYLILRLPDVIGPRDSTFRWWFYQLWIKLSNHLPSQITIPKRLFYKPLSFVYVKDVANIITKALYLPENVYSAAYNLAFPEVKTLYQVLSHIRGRLGKDYINVMLDERPDYSYFYPSVTVGPVDTQKARNILGWNSTSFYEAADQTIIFYEKAIKDEKFGRDANKVIDMLRKHFSISIKDILRAIEEEYGKSDPIQKEEL